MFQREFRVIVGFHRLPFGWGIVMLGVRSLTAIAGARFGVGGPGRHRDNIVTAAAKCILEQMTRQALVFGYWDSHLEFRRSKFKPPLSACSASPQDVAPFWAPSRWDKCCG